MTYPKLESQGDILKMFEEMAEVRRGILQRVARLTPEQLHDPVYAGTWSVLQNLVHLAWAEEFMLAWIRHRPDALPKEARPVEAPCELPAVTTALDEAHAAAIAFVKSHGPEVLREKCLFGRHGEQTVGGVIFHIIEHEIGHRAFVVHKLEKLGV